MSNSLSHCTTERKAQHTLHSHLGGCKHWKLNKETRDSYEVGWRERKVALLLVENNRMDFIQLVGNNSIPYNGLYDAGPRVLNGLSGI